MSDTANGKKSVPLTVVVPLCIALVTGTWAVCAEAHNYRLKNISVRVNIHEEVIQRNSERLSVAETKQGAILDGIREIKQLIQDRDK